jgi:hypothetical protein
MPAMKGFLHIAGKIKNCREKIGLTAGEELAER